MVKLKSDSIFKKRVRKFKSIKRAYYSLIIIVIAYIHNNKKLTFIKLGVGGMGEAP